MLEDQKISPEEDAKFRKYVREYSKKGLLSKEHPDYVELTDEQVRDIIDECYVCVQSKPPEKIIRVASPFEALKTAKRLGKTTYDWSYGAMDANWLAFYMYFKYVKGKVEEVKQLSGIEKALQLGWVISYPEVCIVCDLPEQIHVDDDYRFHCEDGPALEYSDGHGLYYWHGVALNENKVGDGMSWIVDTPDMITADTINSESNAEIKRVMIEKIGFDKYLKMTKAKPIHSDKWGNLYEMEMNGNEKAKVVHVINSTKNDDGSVDEYWIPVDPNITTAKEAVHWTYPGVRKYSPLVET